MNDSVTLDNLNVNSFFAEVAKLPFFNYKLKSIDTPSLSLVPIEVPNPFQKMKVPGDTVEFGLVSFTFLVDENLYNYCSIMNWIDGLGFPDSYDQFRQLISAGTNTTITNTPKKSYTQKETSDLTVHLLTNHRNSNRIIKFYNAFPVNLSGISLNNSNTDSMTVEATVDFAFTGMQFIV